MSFAEDLSVFFNVGEFADEVLVVASSRKFPAIFDEQFFDPETGEAYLEGAKPYLTCKVSDLGADLVKGKAVEVKGIRYTVLQPQPEGTGTAMVLLSKL
jgi:hypothetical protein